MALECPGMKETEVKKPYTIPELLRNKEKVLCRLSEITGQSKESVHRRLREEYENPGINVANAFKQACLEPHIWSDGMADFYRQSDAFLYELVIWNRNTLKRRFRRWVKRYFDSRDGEKKKVLCIGDGLGFDSAYLAQAGYEVTYFEVPGYQLTFAQRVFAETAEEITVITDENDIPLNSFDAVVCLDVLEHVPQPRLFVRQMADYLRPDGWLMIHAPFYMVHSSKPTHLRANRRYSGSLSLFTKNGFRLIDGKGGWNPVVFEKVNGDSTSYKRSRLKLLILMITGLCLSVGRFFVWPFLLVNAYHQKRRNWF